MYSLLVFNHSTTSVSVNARHRLKCVESFATTSRFCCGIQCKCAMLLTTRTIWKPMASPWSRTYGEWHGISETRAVIFLRVLWWCAIFHSTRLKNRHVPNNTSFREKLKVPTRNTIKKKCYKKITRAPFLPSSCEEAAFVQRKRANNRAMTWSTGTQMRWQDF